MRRIGGGSEYGIIYDKVAFKSLLLREAIGKRTRPPPGIQNAIHSINSGLWVGGLIVVCVQTRRRALYERAMFALLGLHLLDAGQGVSDLFLPLQCTFS